MRLMMFLLAAVALNVRAAGEYITANVDNISTDYGTTRAGLVVKLKNASYAACNNIFTIFQYSDFRAQSIDDTDGRSRYEFARSLVISAMMSGKKIEFILKSDVGGYCTATGWVKVLSE